MSNEDVIVQNLIKGNVVKMYKDYIIKLKKNNDSLIIAIYNELIHYKSIYSLDHLKDKCRNLINTNSIDEIIQEISNLIDENKIEIQKNKLTLKTITEETIVLKLQISVKTITKLEKYINKNIKLIIIWSLIVLTAIVIMLSLILSYEMERKIKVIQTSKIKEIDSRIKDKEENNSVIHYTLNTLNDSLITLKKNNNEMNYILNTLNNKLKENNETINDKLNTLNDKLK